MILIALCAIALPLAAAAQSSMPPVCKAVLRPGASLDTVAVRRCSAEDSLRLTAAILREALSHGADSGAVARLALESLGNRYKRAETTKEPDQFREVVEVALLIDSLRPSEPGRFFAAVAGIRLWQHLKRLTTCSAARESVKYLEIALRFPMRPDPGLEPDSMQIQHDIEHWLAQAKDSVRTRCAPSARSPS